MAPFRLQETKNSQRIEEITVGSVVTTYIGNALVASGESAPVWQIARVVEDSSVPGTITTTIMFPNGDNRYGFIWTDRASLTYI